MFEEKNTKTNLPAQIDLYEEGEDAYKFLFMAKGGGSANKTFLYQGTPSLLTHDRMIDFLKEKILTLGTAWIYEHETFGRVANCHKQPQKLFEKKLTTLEEMEMGLWSVLDNFSRAFPNLKIILTLSPVRHIKDGVAENQLSKSLLRVLCANLERRMSSVSYFPAYEIIMDELRDYRFYKSDLIHPSEEAEEYIWQKWQQAIFPEATREKISEIQKVQLELAHRPFNPDTEAHRKFLQNLLTKLERLNNEFDFSEEISEVKSRIEE